MDDPAFLNTLKGLRRGDFSRLEPLFEAEPGAQNKPQIIQWHERGLFRDHPQELAEAFSAASFLGKIEVMEYLLARGVDPVGGPGTGLNAFHWAANRGQLEAVRLLIRAKAPLETRNSYGGTVLSGTVYAALHEPRPAHLQIIEELLAAGAMPDEVEYPTGSERIDSLLRSGASRRERAVKPTDVDLDFVAQAIELAREARHAGNHPFGAVLVLDGTVALKARNTVATDRDPTAHAETNLVAAAIRKLAPEQLRRSVLYTSCEPCAMCAGKMYWAGIRSVVFALSSEELAVLAGRDFLIPCRELFDRAMEPVQVTGPLPLSAAREVHEGFWTPVHD